MSVLERVKRRRELAPLPVIFVQRELSAADMRHVMGWINPLEAVVIPCDARGMVSETNVGRIEACRRGATFAAQVTREARRDIKRRYHLQNLIPITCTESQSLVQSLLKGTIGMPIPNLPQLSSQVRGLGRTKIGIAKIDEWLDSEAWDWLVRGRVALAAVINAAAHLNLPATAGAIALALEYPETIEPILHVAIQRIRWVPVTETLRVRVSRELQRRIEIWEQNEASHSRAAAAMSSMTWMAGADAIPWIRHRLLHALPKVAQGVAQGLLDWASGDPMPTTIGEEDREALYQAALERWRGVRANANVGGLAAALVWATGALAPLRGLREATAAIAEAFQRPVGLEDAAAVRAGRLLVRRHGLIAQEALREVFSGTSDGSRYLTLLDSPPVGV